MATALLTLRAIHATAVEVPMTRPLGTSAQTMRTAPILLIDVETEEGATGHAYLFCYTRMVPGLIATVLTDIADALRGECSADRCFDTSFATLPAAGHVRL